MTESRNQAIGTPLERMNSFAVTGWVENGRLVVRELFLVGEDPNGQTIIGLGRLDTATDPAVQASIMSARESLQTAAASLQLVVNPLPEGVRAVISALRIADNRE
jgi:hypothetical protein